jgi:hypothetical protein
LFYQYENLHLLRQTNIIMLAHVLRMMVVTVFSKSDDVASSSTRCLIKEWFAESLDDAAVGPVPAAEAAAALASPRRWRNFRSYNPQVTE